VTGRVVLVGAGPGDPDLLTVRAMRELERAEVLLYDALIPDSILSLANPNAECVDVGKRGDGTRGISQEKIGELLVAYARRGDYVVRLKGGDPFVFGRGGEEASLLAEAGIPFEVVPAVSSALAVPAYAGIPVTDRRWSSSFTVVTGHRGKEVQDERIDWEGLARSSETLVVLMGTAWIEDITARVIRGGRSASTPAAVISHGTTGRQQTVRATLGELAQAARTADIGAPAVILIGRVAELQESLAWYERRPLFGCRVLMLGAASGESRSAHTRLAARGAIPRHVPLLEFALPAAAERVLERTMSRCHEFDWLLLTSATTVDFLERCGFVPPPETVASAGVPRAGPRVACIGEATARRARQAGWSVARVPAGQAGPEALAKALGDVRGVRILIPRSEQASDFLPGELARLGAKVECVTAYVNRMPDTAPDAFAAAWSDGIDAVLLSSPSCLERWIELRGAEEVREAASRIPCLAIGATTAKACEAQGMRVAAVARETSLHGLVERLEEYFRDLGGAK